MAAAQGIGDVAFEPCNENHAITEVVFAVVGLQGFTPDDRSNVKAAHSKWKPLLPSLQEEAFIAVAAPDVALPQPPFAQLGFARFQPDGEVEWQLRLTQNALVVNCRSYTRWNDVWAVVRDLFANVASVMSSREQKISSVTLEYVDVFRSVGDGSCDAKDLLQENDAVPPSIFARGPVWHLHQGWFVDTQEPVSGRILQRMHIDTMIEGGVPKARFHTSHRFDMRDAPDLQSVFAKKDTLVDDLFGCLHQSSKALLADFLTVEMAKRINLHAG